MRGHVAVLGSVACWQFQCAVGSARACSDIDMIIWILWLQPCSSPLPAYSCTTPLPVGPDAPGALSEQSCSSGPAQESRPQPWPGAGALVSLLQGVRGLEGRLHAALHGLQRGGRCGVELADALQRGLCVQAAHLRQRLLSFTTDTPMLPACHTAGAVLLHSRQQHFQGSAESKRCTSRLCRKCCSRRQETQQEGLHRKLL